MSDAFTVDPLADMTADVASVLHQYASTYGPRMADYPALAGAAGVPIPVGLIPHLLAGLADRALRSHAEVILLSHALLTLAERGSLEPCPEALAEGFAQCGIFPPSPKKLGPTGGTACGLIPFTTTTPEEFSND